MYKRLSYVHNMCATTNNNTCAYIHNSQIQNIFVVDIRCDDLLVPANGEITSCSSGRVGVDYEGDTCSFTYNTGYELTGSDTRTCQW